MSETEMAQTYRAIKEGDVLFTLSAEAVEEGEALGLEYRQIGTEIDGRCGLIMTFGWAPIWSVFAEDVAARLMNFAPGLPHE